jgi:glutamyl-Q tRNA(Asp) synthetase
VPLYPGAAKLLPQAERAQRLRSGASYALRLDTQTGVQRAGRLTWNEEGGGPAGETGTVTAAPEVWGDVVLARKDIPTSYHLSVVIDDAAQGITHVVRGQDLFRATGMHRLLQALLGLPPPSYRHHRLIRDARGEKLAKSTQATGLRELRDQGVTPVEIRRMLGLA